MPVDPYPNFHLVDFLFSFCVVVALFPQNLRPYLDILVVDVDVDDIVVVVAAAAADDDDDDIADDYDHLDSPMWVVSY